MGTSWCCNEDDAHEWSDHSNKLNGADFLTVDQRSEDCGPKGIRLEDDNDYSDGNQLQVERE